MDALLLTALDASSAARLQRYEAELGRVDSWRTLRRVLRRLYREDREVGRVRLLGAMVAGGLMDRELGAQVADRSAPADDTLAIVALALGVAALAMSAIPFYGMMLALPLAVVAVVLGLLGPSWPPVADGGACSPAGRT